MKKIFTALSTAIIIALIPYSAFAKTIETSIFTAPLIKNGGSNLPQSFWWAIMIASAAVIAVTTIMIARMVIKVKKSKDEEEKSE